jgi:hypothetical protein
MKRLAIAAMFAVWGATACDKKEDKPVADPPPVAAPSVSAPASAKPAAAAVHGTTFVVAPDGKVTIDMPAPNEHIKATAHESGGELQIDVSDLAATRGTVKVDLTTLKTATFNDPKKDPQQTEHALNWLEVGTLVTPAEKEKNRFIVYTIQSIDGLSATDLAKVAPTKDGAEDVRVVTAKANGDVWLHGRKSARPAELSVTFHGPPDKPTRVDIKTVKPLKIVLADHDVKPRDNVGKLAQSAFNLLGTKVANEADVSFELNAKPK